MYFFSIVVVLGIWGLLAHWTGLPQSSVRVYQFLSACCPSECTEEFNGRGTFTSLLVDALNGGAADLIEHVTLGGVCTFIDESLGPWDQLPVFRTNVNSFISLTFPRFPMACWDSCHFCLTRPVLNCPWIHLLSLPTFLIGKSIELWSPIRLRIIWGRSRSFSSWRVFALSVLWSRSICIMLLWSPSLVN